MAKLNNYGIPRPDLHAEALAELVGMERVKPGYDAQAHAAELGLPYETYIGRLEVAKRLAEKKLTAQLYKYDLGAAWNLQGDWMVCGDVHVPHADLEMTALLVAVAKKYKVKRLLIAGDFFNFDAFSTYSAVMQPPSWAQEREAARELISYWLSTFAEIRLIAGNHDRRLEKWTAGAFDENDMIRLVTTSDKVSMSNFAYCTVTSGGIDWHITHPQNYSINQLIVAEQLALKHEANVIAFHEHSLAQGYDRFGRYVIINGGCMMRQEQAAYKTLDDNKASNFKSGFVMLRNGVATLFGKHPFTDWSWLR